MLAGASIRRAFTLELGAVNETVSVEGATPLVNTVSAEQSQSISRTEASELPLAKRNVANLLGLGTGVSPGAGFVRLNGVGKTGTLYTVDGTNATADPESRTTSMRGNFEQINLLSLEAVDQVETTKGFCPLNTARLWEATSTSSPNPAQIPGMGAPSKTSNRIISMRVCSS